MRPSAVLIQPLGIPKPWSSSTPDSISIDTSAVRSIAKRPSSLISFPSTTIWPHSQTRPSLLCLENLILLGCFDLTRFDFLSYAGRDFVDGLNCLSKVKRSLNFSRRYVVLLNYAFPGLNRRINLIILIRFSINSIIICNTGASLSLAPPGFWIELVIFEVLYFEKKIIFLAL